MANLGPIAPVLTDSSNVDELNPNGGGVLNQLPSLKQVSDSQRTNLTTFNEYRDSTGNRYGNTHPNAQSDGDEFGRGEVSPNAGVGTLTDKLRKDTLLYNSGNKYAPGSGYYNFLYAEEYW